MMRPLPSRKQLDFLDWEFGAFFHFGIRTFYPGHSDWDGIDMPAAGFLPEELDCRQWLRAVKRAGATYAIMTCKHHDGFALWQSEVSDYGVADSPWRGGKGDVVKEFTDACRAEGMKTGLYYSSAQWGGSVPFDNAEAYDEYFLTQITELLTRYGKIDYLWFDGCGSEGHEYDKERIVRTIRSLQPGILTFCNPDWSPDVRWIGNEDGFAGLPNLLVSERTVYGREGNAVREKAFLPAECDCRIRKHWFWDDDGDTLKTADELFGMYLASAGRGSNFLLNIGPDPRGLLPEADVERLAELGDRIREHFSSELPFRISAEDGNAVALEAEGNAGLARTVVLEEDLSGGQAIESFEVYAALPVNRDQRILLIRGTTVGHKRILSIPPMRTPEITVTFRGEGASLKKISVFA